MTGSTTGRRRAPAGRRPDPAAAGAGRRADGRGRRPTTSERILDAALASFATRGYEASSLDALAVGLDIRKQTILYWFPSKEVLLEAVIDRSAVELSAALEASLAAAGTGLGPGGGGGALGVPAGRPPARAARPGPRDGPAGDARPPPGS